MIMSQLTTLKVKSMKLYFEYKEGLITLEEYLERIKPLDEDIDKLEMSSISCHLEDTPAFEKAFS